MYVNKITSPITNFCLIPSLFKLQELRQQAQESGRKHMEMTDMLKVAEAKAVGVIVKKVVKGKKQSKIPTKTSKIPKDPTVTKKTNKKTKLTKQSKLDDVEDNEYLNMCSEKKKKNTDRLNSIAQDLRDAKEAKKTTPKKRTTRISIKTGAKRRNVKSTIRMLGCLRRKLTRDTAMRMGIYMELYAHPVSGNLKT